MTPHGRTYGDRPSHPIYVWNGVLEPKHRKKIGAAIWEFLWCLDRITTEKDGVGVLLGGKPVTHSEMAESFKVSEKTILRHMDSLELHGYIDRKLTPRGYVIRVPNSRKFAKQVGQNCPTTEASGRTEVSPQVGQKCHPGGDRSVQPNKSKQLNESVEQAAAACPTVWQFLGVDGSKWSGSVREVCAKLYKSKNGDTPVEFIGACMNGIESMGGRIPPALAQRATFLRSQSKTKSTDSVPELEELPWAK